MTRCARRQKNAIKPFLSFPVVIRSVFIQAVSSHTDCLSTTHYVKLLPAFIENVFCEGQEIFYDSGVREE